jgi:hypothetical protein
MTLDTSFDELPCVLFLNKKVNTVEIVLDTRMDDGMRSGFPRDSTFFSEPMNRPFEGCFKR